MLSPKNLFKSLLIALFIIPIGMTFAQTSAPSNLMVSVENGVAKLSWDASSESVKGYNIYRAFSTEDVDLSSADLSAFEYSLIGNTAEASYEDNLSASETSGAIEESSQPKFVFYYITAVSEDGSESEKSNFVGSPIAASTEVQPEEMEEPQE